MRLETTASNDEDSGGAAGWSIADAYDYKHPTEGWQTGSAGTSTRIAINGTVIAPIEVPVGWSLVPSGLGTGERFRLMFLTRTRNATPTDIDVYNEWAQVRAAGGHDDIQRYAEVFKVLGCTEDVDARDNTGTTYTSTDKGVPIYWLNGNKADDDYEDFYDGGVG